MTTATRPSGATLGAPAAPRVETVCLWCLAPCAGASVCALCGGCQTMYEARLAEPMAPEKPHVSTGVGRDACRKADPPRYCALCGAVMRRHDYGSRLESMCHFLRRKSGGGGGAGRRRPRGG